jgi:alpha-beta hydrolase superfamily lysophospholipase
MISRGHDLHEMGFATSIIGFRGSGNSDGDYTTIGFEESEDVLNSYKYYKNKFPDLPIVLFGTSMGSAAILKAFENPQLIVNGIIIEYPFGTLHQTVKNRFKIMGFPSFPMATMLTYWGGFQLNFNAFDHNPQAYAKNVTCPVLYFAGDKDDRVTDEETAAVFKNITSTDKQLYIFKNGGHENLNESFTKEWSEYCKNFLTRVTGQ